MKKLNPIHPGEILREEFLKALGISAYRLAKETRVPFNRVTAIVNEQRGISLDTALRFSRYFGTTAEFWINLQKNYELRVARREWGKKIEKEVPILAQS